MENKKGKSTKATKAKTPTKGVKTQPFKLEVEMEKLQLLEMKVNVAQRMADLRDGHNNPFFSKAYIMKNILEINDADLV